MFRKIIHTETDNTAGVDRDEYVLTDSEAYPAGTYLRGSYVSEDFSTGQRISPPAAATAALPINSGVEPTMSKK